MTQKKKQSTLNDDRQIKPTFDQLVEMWKEPVDVPVDPEFMQKVQARIVSPVSNKFRGAIATAWISAAAVLLVVAGIELGRLMQHDPLTTSTSDPANEMVINDLEISDFEANPYEALLVVPK
jgi:cytochrome c-type biogenesis protein CcmH/NrfG